jgi:uncharacterized protein YeaO (DUF488 family)
MSFEIKRIYEPAGEGDGKRVLVDRLWPRGVTKEAARLDEWLKEIAPSPQLRTWFGHESEKFDEFTSRYRQELDNDPQKQAAVRRLFALNKAGKVTLLYGAKSDSVNHAAVLQRYLMEWLTDF